MKLQGSRLAKQEAELDERNREAELSTEEAEEAKREAIERQCGSVKLAGLQTKLAEHIQNNIRFWEQIENERATEATAESDQTSGE